MSRACCTRCGRPLKVCCCRGLETRDAPVDLLILQHPSEVKKAIGTARLLALGYRNCRLEVGEEFSCAPWREALLERYRGRTWVLFPRVDALKVVDLPPLPVSAGPKTDQKPLLILLDGTWRKAQKIAHLNPWLEDLPAIGLCPERASRYRIRKAPRADSLSTLEAAVFLLRQWSGRVDEGQELLEAFERMIEQQIEAMGEAVYRRNYSGHGATGPK